MGYIYIMTNPSFEEYVKIGYAKDVKKRLNELNSSSAVPFAFRIYATYEVASELSDKKVHAILDKLNPDLRSKERINGKERIKEFYAMTPEDAYSILEAIAEINGLKSKLKKWKATAEEKEEEKLAEQITIEHRSKAKMFTFSSIDLCPGDKVTFCKPGNKYDNTDVEIVDDKHVSYDETVLTLTALATMFIKPKNNIAGPDYFKYNGIWLNDLRREKGIINF